MVTNKIPLSLYIHFPWCLSKCPYCDFNSYPLSDKPSIKAYVNKLLFDFDCTSREYANKELISVYFGGGTPSLLPPEAITTILNHVKKTFTLMPNTEITVEANPGTINLSLCHALKKSGVNRLSLGIQSFNDDKLELIKRIHTAKEAIKAVETIKKAGFRNFNLDLMYGLPEQSPKEALEDLKQALRFQPPHLSWYQLTIDQPQTIKNFARVKLPNHEKLWETQKAGQEYLKAQGLLQYEVSGYSSSAATRCNHNLNYWLYGDYIGIGAGAHGKVTLDNYRVKRYKKISNPTQYLLSKSLVAKKERVSKKKLPLDFMLNALRLYQPLSYDLLKGRAGISIMTIKKQLQSAENLGLIELKEKEGVIITTERGKNFLNDLLEIFT
jgi:putative oxygen-independent coproporphyrinogen III oxidase